jgi:hypothetical protein
VWAEQRTFDIAGRTVCVRINSPVHLDALLALLPATRTPSDNDLIDTMLSVLHGGMAREGHRPFHLVFLNHKRIARSDDFDATLAALSAALNTRLARSV